MEPPGGSAQSRSWLSAFVALTLALFIAGVVLGRLAHSGGAAVVVLPIAALGALIARRARPNPIGWVLLGYAAWFALYVDIGQYAVLAIRVHHGHLPLGRAAVVVSSELWILDFLILPIVILLFPDGRLPRAWRRVLHAYLAVVALAVGILLWAGAEQVASSHLQITGQGQLADNPGATGALVAPFIVCLVAIPAFWVSFVVRQVVSWRRASDERREQLKWLMAGAVLSVVGLASTVVLAQFSGPAVHPALAVTLALGLFSLPLAFTVGILKYRLYDIDRLISRTVSYAIVTGAVVALYVAVITLATRAFGFSSSVAVASSTLGAAAVVNPLRIRVQRGVDRRFNRARYDAQATVMAFAEHLRSEVDLNAISRDLLTAVRVTLEPSQTSIWLPNTRDGSPIS